MHEISSGLNFLLGGTVFVSLSDMNISVLQINDNKILIVTHSMLNNF
jgi:hypothetical protein